ncbi:MULTISPECIES: DUF72 domain-containing protein [Pseudoalteromonas]|uniref:DUF72 domain-containing protein n=1 Tax=Pseudoalteromonas TaxID=53246 RepID=UPI000F79CBE6|nr:MULTISPECIES: DUF72 domain-containing protein [Pseudoalteromonas]MCG7560380.1 DUF72 domain-containing protein [Pseudoalteromonas sp. McH1-42]MEC4087375.1 DUF72 domain-containing protein [Pseudoalteromonas rubra]
MLYLGCPQWSAAHWKGRFFTSDCKTADMLREYAQIFNSVEGNTSFYASPKPETITAWSNAVPDTFRFTFKIPKHISHELALSQCQQELKQWLNLFEPLFSRLGMVMLQLPASCSPEYLTRIADFITQMPKELTLGIEVRHRDFFAKGDAEKRFNQLLMHAGVNRIIMDTRPLFSEPPATPAIIDAQQKKPRVPVNVIATSQAPMLRFVGCSDLTANRAFYAPWLNKIRVWLNEGRTPYVFFHTADNHDAPLLARQFIQDLGIPHQVLDPFPAERQPQQQTLI